jgi:hypothetical protein
VSARPPSISEIEFGFDLQHLYVRVTGTVPMRDIVTGEQHVSLKFLKPEGCRIVVAGGDGGVRAEITDRPRTAGAPARNCPDIKGAAGRLLELQVPFQCLGAVKDSTIAFIVAVSQRGAEIEHHPRHQAIELQVPDEMFPARNWTA